MATGKIFINYRRDDSRGDSGRIYDFLSARFPGQVFRDIGSLEPGADWQHSIGRVIGQSDACIVVIGCNWLNIKGDDGKRRLDDPADTVRREVFAALQRNIAVIPVLVGGARPPKPQELPLDLQPLCDRHALTMTEEEWPECCQKLARALETALGAGPAAAPTNVVATPPKKSSSGAKWFLALAAGGAIFLLTLVAAVAVNKHPASSVPTPVPAINPIPAQPSPAVPDGRQRLPVSRPIPPAETPSSSIGIWNAVVNVNGATLYQVVEMYGDQSFRVLLNGTLQAVGSWQSDALGQISLTNGTNFVTGLHFSCGSRANEDGTGTVVGNCSDRMNNMWSFTMTRGVGVPAIPFIPRVDVSQLSLAERAAFIQVLSVRRCTCPCGMSVYMCLQKDATCNFSPAIAQNALMMFLRSTRGG
jgi:hypothetical protein